MAVGNNDAACVLECAPGRLRCGGTVVVAPDGTSGYGMEAACNDDGELETAVACAAGELCRVSGQGEHVGCVQCIGPEVLGGNALGIMDSRCADAANVQTCAADNTWSASRACTAGTTCTGPVGATCGNCLSAAGNLVVCTETNVNDQELCGGCTVNATALSVCTETAISALTTGAETCATHFGGASTAWGGEPDCCDGNTGAFLQYTNEGCIDLFYGAPSPWGGETQCCATAQLAAGGPDFAYCAP
jgi:hypothetical protein